MEQAHTYAHRSSGRYRFRRRFFRVITTMLLLFVGLAAFGEDQAPRLEPDPRIRSLGNRPSPLDVPTIIETSLVFSGVESNEIGKYRNSIERLIRISEDKLDNEMSPYEKGEMLLEVMHEQVLSRYYEPQTRIDVLFDTGRYNCVSSAVIYFILARNAGLDIQGTVTSDHAFCSIRVEDEVVDVETTALYGYDPGRRKEFYDKFGNLTGYTYVPPSNYSDRKTADDKELLALILHNRISELQREHSYAAALEVAVDRHGFLDSEKSLEDLTRSVSNYLSELNNQRAYDRAFDVIDSVIGRYEVGNALDTIRSTIARNVVVSRIQQNNFDEARSSLMQVLHEDLIDRDEAESLKNMLASRDLSYHLPEMSIEDGFDYIDTVARDLGVAEKTVRDFRLSLYARKAEEVSRAEGYLAAAQLIEEGIERLGSDPRLQRALETYRYNYSAMVHNRFAELFNQRKIDAARDVIQEALEKFPNSRMLKNDLATIERYREQQNR